MLSVVSGCGGNAARDQALKDAAAARARGDLIAEVEAMRAACAADPRNADLCGKSNQLGEYARAQTRDAAAAACGLVDTRSPATIDGCMIALRPLRRLFPDDPDALRMTDAAGDAFFTLCTDRAGTGDISSAIRRARCVDAGADTFATGQYATHVAAARADAAALLVDTAARRDVADRLGARAATLAAAACLTGTPDLRDTSAQAARAFVEASAPTLHVRATGMSAAELCAATSDDLGGRLTCAAAPDSRAVVLEAAVSVSRVSHAVSERTQTERYLAGVDRYDNPEYPVRARDEMYSRDVARGAEQDYRTEQQSCDAADAELTRASYCYDCTERTERDTACRRAEDAKTMWDERASDWQRARDALDSTPAVLEREDWRDTSFVVRDHAWSAPWEADLRALPGATSRASGVATTADSESHGSDLAGIAADPLTQPSAGWYLPQVRAQVAAQLANLASAELAARVTTLRGQCPSEQPDWSDAAWLDCYATSLLVSGSALGSSLLAAEAAASDRANGPGLPALACR